PTWSPTVAPSGSWSRTGARPGSRPAGSTPRRREPTARALESWCALRWWWSGPPQSAISHQFADLEDGYGFLVESAQSTTGLFAAASPWLSGRDHKERMLAWRRCAPFINLTRDHG